MAKALHRKPKPVFANGEEPPPGVDPAQWDPIADPNAIGVFQSGSDAGHMEYDYGDFVTHLRQRVMADELSPQSIQRPEAAWRLNQELDRTPYLYEVSTGRDEAICRDRRAMFGDAVTHHGPVRRDANKLAEVRAAYDLTEDEYQQWLAKRNTEEQR